MATNDSRPAFTPFSADDIDEQLTEIQSLCMNCYGQGQTRLLLIRIPYYKDVILSSFECELCHFKNNDIQPAQGTESYGILINVHVTNNRDLNRQIVKSGYGTIRIQELDFEQAPVGVSGVLTTIEGLLSSIVDNLNKTIKQIDETIDETNKNSTDNNDEKNVTQFIEQKSKLQGFITRVESMKSLSETFHFEIDDPTGNSFIENPNAPYRDEQMTIKKYRRTSEQNSLLGLTDEEEASIIQEPVEEKSDLIEPDEILVFKTICPDCGASCDTNMKTTRIPHFKEVIIMATNCDYCGHKSNEVKSGAGIAPKGIRYRLVMNDSIDLNRDILVSETASFAIPDLDFELSSSKSIGGRFTTLEGIFTTLKSQLSSIIMPFSGGDSCAPNSDKNHMKRFLDEMSLILAGEKFVTVELDDPAGNCYLQNICAPEPDPQLTVEHYERTEEQNELLGLNDMKVENYEES